MMAKRKWLGLFEKNLSFLNEVSAGVGLIVGYSLFSIYWLTTPDTIVEVTTQSVVYEEKVIGYVPKTQNIDSKSVVDSLDRNVPVTANMPVLDTDGQPVLEQKVITYRGKGNPQIIVDHKEIVVPKLKSNEVQVLSSPNMAGDESFYLDTILHGTGFYYEDKRVEFDGVMSPDIFAIRMGTLFAFLALVLLIIRVRAIPRTADFLRSLVAPEKGDGFITPESLTAHYHDVDVFKKNYEESRLRAIEEYFHKNKERSDSAYQNLMNYAEAGNAYLATGIDEDEYVLTSDGLSYIEFPVKSDLVDTEHNNHMLQTLNPLDIKSLSKDEADFLINYYKNLGHPNLRAVRLKKAVMDMLDNTRSIRELMIVFYQRKGLKNVEN